MFFQQPPLEGMAHQGRQCPSRKLIADLARGTWHMLANQQPYQELGGDYFDQRKKETKVSYLVRRLEKLTGGSVSIDLQPAAA